MIAANQNGRRLVGRCAQTRRFSTIGESWERFKDNAPAITAAGGLLLTGVGLTARFYKQDVAMKALEGELQTLNASLQTLKASLRTLKEVIITTRAQLLHEQEKRFNDYGFGQEKVELQRGIRGKERAVKLPEQVKSESST